MDDIRNKKKKIRKIKRVNEEKLRLFAILGCLLLIILIIFGLIFRACHRDDRVSPYGTPDPAYDDGRPYIDVQLLTPNEYSRPCIPSDGVRGIVIHYVGNPGSSAQSNRDYFEGLKDSGETYASSNFIVGLEGEVIQCIPTNEIAYCSNERNSDTVSIEVCHETADGKFNDHTYSTLVNLTGWLCMYLDVSPKNVIRHYDVTGKICPKYYVEHEDAWDTFIDDVKVWIRTEKSRQ